MSSRSIGQEYLSSGSGACRSPTRKSGSLYGRCLLRRFSQTTNGSMRFEVIFTFPYQLTYCRYGQTVRVITRNSKKSAASHIQNGG